MPFLAGHIALRRFLTGTLPGSAERVDSVLTTDERLMFCAIAVLYTPTDGKGNPNDAPWPTSPELMAFTGFTAQRVYSLTRRLGKLGAIECLRRFCGGLPITGPLLWAPHTDNGATKGRRRFERHKRSLRWQVYVRDGIRCRQCGVTDEAELSVDHIVPIVAGGTDDLANLQILCKTCNQAKGASLALGDLAQRERQPV